MGGLESKRAVADGSGLHTSIYMPRRRLNDALRLGHPIQSALPSYHSPAHYDSEAGWRERALFSRFPVLHFQDPTPITLICSVAGLVHRRFCRSSAAVTERDHE